MAWRFLVLTTFYLQTGLMFSGTYGVNIRLYRNQNFTGLLWQSNSTEGCYNIPDDKHVEVYSIRTDTCFIVYEQSNCNSRWSMKFQPGDINLSENEITYIFSFQTCTDEEGGNQLNVDITKHYEYRFTTPPDVLHRYKNVCSCVNIPKNAKNLEQWSIDNHHNSLLAYYETDCSENKWNSKFITAGQNVDSREMQNHKLTDKSTNKVYTIESIGPDPNSPYFRTSCNFYNVTKENWKFGDSAKLETFDSTTERVDNTDNDAEDRIQVLINKLGELHTQFDQLNQNHSDSQKSIEAALNQQNVNINKLVEQITKFQRNVESSLRILNRTCTKCQCG